MGLPVLNFLLPPLPKKIKPYREHGSCKEAYTDNSVTQFGVDMGAGNFVGIIYNERTIGQIVLAQGRFNVPLPVGNGAVAPAKPNTQNIPAAGGKANANQVQPARAWPYPPQQVKAYYNSVENGE